MTQETSSNHIQFKHFSIEPPKKKHAFSLGIAFITIAIFLVASFAFLPKLLFATNTQIITPSQYSALENAFHTMDIKFKSLLISHEDLTEQLASLEQKVVKYEQEKTGLSKQLSLQQKELSETKRRYYMLEDVNKYLLARSAKEEEHYNKLSRSLVAEVECYKQSLEDETNSYIKEYCKRIHERYLEQLKQDQKPYKEYFYNSYDK